MKIVNKLSIIIFGLVFSLNVYSDIIFEGYYKIYSQSKHIGFVVQSYEYDDKKKQFKSIYYIKTKIVKGGSSESLVALSDSKFQPISYQYTSQIGKRLKSIDATFTKKKKLYFMKAKISDGKTVKRVSKTLAKGSFLSTFLIYLMLQKGYDVNTKFNYVAVAEEDAEAYNGQVLIKEDSVYQEKKVHKLLGQFKGVKFYSYTTLTGEVAYSESPVQQISTQLVKSPAEATVGFVLNTNIVKKLFGRVPVGKKNYLNKVSVLKVKPKKELIKTLVPKVSSKQAKSQLQKVEANPMKGTDKSKLPIKNKRDEDKIDDKPKPAK